MSLLLEREKIQRITEELEVIIAAHLAWFKQINLTLVCGGPVYHLDLEDDSHLRTRSVSGITAGSPMCWMPRWISGDWASPNRPCMVALARRS